MSCPRCQLTARKQASSRSSSTRNHQRDDAYVETQDAILDWKEIRAMTYAVCLVIFASTQDIRHRSLGEGDIDGKREGKRRVTLLLLHLNAFIDLLWPARHLTSVICIATPFSTITPFSLYTIVLQYSMIN